MLVAMALASFSHVHHGICWTPRHGKRKIGWTETLIQGVRFQSIVLTGTRLSVPYPRFEACRAKGNRMRTLVQPPPSLRCDLCHGELRLKQLAPDGPAFDFDI